MDTKRGKQEHTCIRRHISAHPAERRKRTSIQLVPLLHLNELVRLALRRGSSPQRLLSLARGEIFSFRENQRGNFQQLFVSRLNQAQTVSDSFRPSWPPKCARGTPTELQTCGQTETMDTQRKGTLCASCSIGSASGWHGCHLGAFVVSWCQFLFLSFSSLLATTAGHLSPIWPPSGTSESSSRVWGHFGCSKKRPADERVLRARAANYQRPEREAAMSGASGLQLLCSAECHSFAADEQHLSPNSSGAEYSGPRLCY